MLPAFLAGFVAAAGLGAVIVPLFHAPLERELHLAREDTATANRALAQERALLSQLELSRDATARLAKDACEREMAQRVQDTVAEAEARCASALDRKAEACSAKLAAAAAAATAEAASMAYDAPKPSQPDLLASPAPPTPPSPLVSTRL